VYVCLNAFFTLLQYYFTIKLPTKFKFTKFTIEKYLLRKVTSTFKTESVIKNFSALCVFTLRGILQEVIYHMYQNVHIQRTDNS
jgi:hypothetical protein